MTETPTAETKKSLPKGAGNIWTDIGPVLAFVIVFNVLQNRPEGPELFSKDNAIFWATGVFMAAVALSIGWTLAKGRRLPPMLIITGTVVMVFGGLTLFLQDKTFAFIKPTIINILFALTILGSTGSSTTSPGEDDRDGTGDIVDTTKPAVVLENNNVGVAPDPNATC